MNKLTLCLLAVLLPVRLAAQDQTSEPESAEAPRYTVEVIIFRYAEDVATGNEIFRPEAPAADIGEDGVAVFTDERRAPAADAKPDATLRDLPNTDLVLLDEADYQLGGALRQLQLLDAYEPLMHFGWTQVTWPEEQTEPIPLHLFARPPEALDGTLELYLSRFLHLVVDLRLRSSEPGPAPSAGSGFDGFGADRMPGEALVRPPVYFRINDDRILRSGELRYFDHPKFGMLARVTHVDQEDDPREGELLGYPVQ
ncbi:MAG: CsiV family protein [Woeseiaceae bacterium]